MMPQPLNESESPRPRLRLAPEPDNQSYEEAGLVLIPQAIPTDSIDALLENYMSLVREVSGQAFTDPNGADLVAFYNEHRDVETRIYSEIRRPPLLKEFSRQDCVVKPVARLLGDRLGLFRKIPFRIDMPFWTDELAYWHQDYFYVKGNTDVVTAWIPLQDTTYVNGCLSIMPRSHKFGVLPHDLIIGKKRVPSAIFDNEIRLVEMRKGDVLLFNSLLLHAGNLNLSAGIRYSVQARYTPLDGAADEGMGGVISLSEGRA
jgi:ectoine hydroxylase-related dioxygenase (phytanoyl-CoA dioxygenase family)